MNNKLDINDIKDLNFVSESSSNLEIGSLLTHTNAINSNLIKLFLDIYEWKTYSKLDFGSVLRLPNRSPTYSKIDYGSVLRPGSESSCQRIQAFRLRS